MQDLKMAATVASILLILTVTYFVAVRGGSVDLPMPWGQSATVQVPGPREPTQSARPDSTPSGEQEYVETGQIQVVESQPCTPGTFRPVGNRMVACGALASRSTFPSREEQPDRVQVQNRPCTPGTFRPVGNRMVACNEVTRQY